MKKKFLKQKGGYTILETMVAVSLFLVIAVTGMGTLLNANLLSQKSQDVRSIIDNLSFVIEDMSRNMRTTGASSFHCFVTGDSIPSVSSPVVSTPKSCASGWGIAFEPATGNDTNNDDQWIYYISGTGKIYKATQGPYTASNFVLLTPDEVVIDAASSFAVLGAESSATNSQQPLIMIRLVGKITLKNNVVTPFSLQTSVSQRVLDI